MTASHTPPVEGPNLDHLEELYTLAVEGGGWAHYHSRLTQAVATAKLNDLSEADWYLLDDRVREACESADLPGMSDPAIRLQLLDVWLNRTRATAPRAGFVGSLLLLADLLAHHGGAEFDAAKVVALCDEAATIATATADWESAAKAHLGAGTAFMVHQGAYASQDAEARGLVAAAHHLEAAFTIARRLSDHELTFMALNNLAAVRFELSGSRQIDTSIQHLLDEAVQLSRDYLGPRDQGLAEHNRGVYLLEVSDTDGSDFLDAAVVGLRRALQLRRNGDPHQEAETLLALGTALAKGAGAPPPAWREAKQVLSQAIQIFARAADCSRQFAVAHMHLANLLRTAPDVRPGRVQSLFRRARAELGDEASIENALVIVNQMEHALSSGVRLDRSRARADLEFARVILESCGFVAEAARAVRCVERLS